MHTVARLGHDRCSIGRLIDHRLARQLVQQHTVCHQLGDMYKYMHVCARQSGQGYILRLYYTMSCMWQHPWWNLLRVGTKTSSLGDNCCISQLCYIEHVPVLTMDLERDCSCSLITLLPHFLAVLDYM